MLSEFHKKLRWWVLIAYCCIVFLGELVHAIPGLGCNDGCCTVRTAAMDKGTRHHHGSEEKPCAFCAKRQGNPGQLGEGVSSNTKTESVIGAPHSPCQVCKLIAVVASVFVSSEDTTLASEIVAATDVALEPLHSIAGIRARSRSPPLMTTLGLLS